MGQEQVPKNHETSVENDEVVSDLGGQALKDTEGSERRDKLVEDADDLLDEIDDVLEENAEDFVKAYIQKGGE